MTKAAPVIFFCFNRPDNAREALEAIVKFKSPESDLFIFCDGPRNVKEISKVAEVHKVLDSFQNHAKEIIKKDINHGLKPSVIAGINYVFSLGYDRACVIEDDIIIGQNFLKYCDLALEKFQDDKTIFSVTGFNFPGLLQENKIFKVRKFCSWGWAIWKDRWQSINFDPNQPEIDHYLQHDRKSLREVSENFHEFLKFVRTGKIDSWATFAFFECVKHGYKNIYPCQPLVKNIGFVGGTHFKDHDPISEIYSKKDVDFAQPLPELMIEDKCEKKFNRAGISGKRQLIKPKSLQKLIMMVVGFLLGLVVSHFIG